MWTTAAVSRGPASKFVIEDVEIDSPAEGEILVRLVATGMCHTDLTSRHVTGPDVPAVYGHEGAGVVEAVGRGVDAIRAGDHVVLSFDSCGVCPACSSGARAYCVEFGRLNAGGRRRDGTSVLTMDGEPLWSSFFGQSSFARHAVANQQNAVVVPASLDLLAAAPLGCGFQTGAGSVANVLRAGPSDAVVVYGAGGVGMAAIMAAAALGVSRIVAVDLSAERRTLALDVGATHAVDGGTDDLVDHIAELTQGGASHALDTTAVPAVVRAAVRALAPRGTLVVVGIGKPEFDLDALDLVTQGKTVRGSVEGDSDPHLFIPTMLGWMAQGRFPIEKVVTGFPFEQINEAADAAHGAVVKPVLEF